MSFFRSKRFDIALVVTLLLGLFFAYPAFAVDRTPETTEEIKAYRNELIQRQYARIDHIHEKPPVKIDSLKELDQYAGKSHVHVKMEPGTYRITPENLEQFAEVVSRKKQTTIKRSDGRDVFKVIPAKMGTLIDFSGHHSYFDLRGVEIKIDTRIQNDYADVLDINGRKHGINEIRASGFGLMIVGLEITDVNRAEPGEKNYPTRSARTFSASCKRSVFKDMHITSRGSTPYGYSSFLGKGGPSLTRIQKHSAVQPGRGDNNVFIDFDITNRAFGHAISWARNNRLTFIGCRIEGAIRSTNAIYKETSGPAYENDFKTHWGERIPRKMMISTGEDAFRAYRWPLPKGPREEGHIKILNCEVTKMRSGTAGDVSFNGTYFVSNTTLTKNTMKNFSVPSNSKVVNSRGDVRYAPLIHIKTAANNEYDLTVLPSPTPPDIKRMRVTLRRNLGIDVPRVAAIITGPGHEISLEAKKSLQIRGAKPVILIGTNKRGAEDVVLKNNTKLPIWLHEDTEGCHVNTRGKVIADNGNNNQIERISELPQGLLTVGGLPSW
jgi:hypothetical protein